MEKKTAQKSASTDHYPREMVLLSKTPYTKLYEMQYPKEETAILVSTNYKTHVSVGANPNKMTTVRGLIDTGANPVLVSASF